MRTGAGRPGGRGIQGPDHGLFLGEAVSGRDVPSVPGTISSSQLAGRGVHRLTALTGDDCAFLCVCTCGLVCLQVWLSRVLWVGLA